MRLTTKGRYAVTAILDVALHHDAGPVSLAEIAHRQGISKTYLEQLFSLLRRRGLVVSTRGPGGGYRLARAAEKIAVSDVIGAVDEVVDATRCGGAQNCRGEQACLTHDLWADLSRQIQGFLSEINLAQLVERRKGRERRSVCKQSGALRGSEPASPEFGQQIRVGLDLQLDLDR